MMVPWRAPAVLIGVVVVLLFLEAWMTPAVATATYGNACFKINKRLPVTPFLTLTTDTLVMCIVSCTSRQNCQAFNFKNSTKTCELLNTTLCDGDAVDLLSSPGWNYYDLQDSQDQALETPLYNDPACINYGICSEKCLRLAGQTCRNTSQCTYLINGVSSCVLGVCKCAPLTNYYSTQRPVQPNNCTDILPWYFWNDRAIIKRIDPTNVCYISFQLKTSSSAIYIHLATGYYFTANRYTLSILPQGQFIISRVTNNVVYNMATTVYPGLLSSTAYILIKFSWCNGQLRAGPQGNELVLSWNDPSPLTITNVILQSATDNAQTWIKGNNMMDQWSPGGNVTTPGDYRTTITKKVAVGKNSTNYATTFYCKGARDCEFLFLATPTYSDYYRVCIGCWGNAQSYLSFSRNGQSEVGVVDAVANRLDVNNYKQFWIQIMNGNIMVGSGGMVGQQQWTSLQDTSGSPPVVVNYVFLRGCCNVPVQFYFPEEPDWNALEWGLGIP